MALKLKVEKKPCIRGDFSSAIQGLRKAEDGFERLARKMREIKVGSMRNGPPPAPQPVPQPASPPPPPRKNENCDRHLGTSKATDSKLPWWLVLFLF